MKNVVISIFVFPWEIDGLERILTSLKEASCFCENDVRYTLSVTLDMSNERVDWASSKLPVEFFKDKFENLKKLCNWCDIDFDLNEENNCFGSAGKRRKDAIKYKNKCDAYIWLDPDMYFPMHILQVLNAALNSTEEKMFVITPELIRYWDTSWDAIVNKKFLKEPHNHRDYFDMYSVNMVAQELEAPYIEKLNNGMKFGGGWFTCISHDLMQKASVPKFIGDYGPDDTWITAFSMNYNNAKRQQLISQYVMRNVVVTEIGKTYITENHYKKHLQLKSVDIEAHKNSIWQVFNQELQNHIKASI
jgi:hypothetical protein